jgi:hypothetical protein
VAGHIICKLLQGVLLEDAAGVGGGLGKHGKWKVAVLGGVGKGGGVHGDRLLSSGCTAWGGGAVALPYVRSVGRNGLGAWGLLSLEGFGEALLSQVLVPQLGEAFVFRVKLQVIAVVRIADESAPLLNPCVVVAVIEGI